MTNNRGVDVVIEHVGEATWGRRVRWLARGGRLVTCGATFPLVHALTAQRGSGRIAAGRENRPRGLMRYQRIGISLFTLIAVVSIVLAAATIWLFLTNPVTVANAVNEGEVSPFVRNLAEVLYNALRGILKYL